MPRKVKSGSKAAREPSETFIFEIQKCRPSYLFSINRSRFRETAFSEYLDIEIAALCIFPSKFVRMHVLFNLAARRGCLTPEAFQEDPDWIPNCIGVLELSSKRGGFSIELPHESMTALAALLPRGSFRYIVLHGSPLSRGRSWCSTMQLEQTVNLKNY